MHDGIMTVHCTALQWTEIGFWFTLVRVVFMVAIAVTHRLSLREVCVPVTL